jgi:hypothetical protein
MTVHPLNRLNLCNRGSDNYPSFLIALWIVILILPITIFSNAVAQQSRWIAAIPERFEKIEAQADVETIDELIQRRIQKEWDSFGTNIQPELLKTEANYIRVSTTSKEVLYEASFHLQPHYYTHSPTGPDTLHRISPEQPVMYYVGSARTPLALPVVSNLSKTLSGDEASYTVNLGVLPLPCPGYEKDSVRYYVVIERAIESNHTDNIVRLERFAKEFTVKADEPIPLRLTNEPLAKGAYIVRLESGAVLDFYDDFARFIDEHILLNSERIHFRLGKETVSDISSRLSIPYSVARTSHVKVELLSVVDTAHALPIVDTIRPPADYLAELDMSNFADGPYRYRLIANDMGTGKLLYDSTITFQKSAPVMIMGSGRLTKGDTLEVGGKKEDIAAILKELHSQLTMEKVVNDRIHSSLDQSEDEKRRLEEIVQAEKRNTIADVHGRAGLGKGASAGDNFFVGIEASKPALAFDVSFGFLYKSTSWLSSTPPLTLSQFTSSPKSLGFQLTWIYLKTLNGLVEPLVSVGYYGIWSNPLPGGLGSATLLSASLGVACEPLGEMNGLGLSLSVGATTGLGLSQPVQTDVNFKAYIRF